MAAGFGGFSITNWPSSPTPDPFNPCTNTLFLWQGGTAPFSFSYTLGNLSGECANTKIETQGVWWGIDQITGYSNTSEYDSITFQVTDSTGLKASPLIRPFAFSDLLNQCVNRPGVTSASTNNGAAQCEELVAGDGPATTTTSVVNQHSTTATTSTSTKPASFTPTTTTSSSSVAPPSQTTTGNASKRKAQFLLGTALALAVSAFVVVS